MTTPSRPPVTPLDPDSPKGREIAARLSLTFADVRDAIAARKARQAKASRGKEETTD